MSRRTIALSAIPAVAVALAMAGPAEAHQGTVSITCPTASSPGHVDYRWTNFPAGSGAFRQTKVDGRVTAEGFVRFSGTGSQSDPFTVPQDGRAHSVSGYTDWSADGGGTAGLTRPCTLAVPPTPPTPTPVPPTPTPPTPVPPTPVPPTPVPPTPTPECKLGTKCCPVCASRRDYRWTIRERYYAPGASRNNGQRIVSAVTSWRGKDGMERETARRVRLNGRVRLRGHADYRGRVVVKGFSAHITIRATLANGARVTMNETVQLCIPPEGNPNAPTSSAPPSSRSVTAGTATPSPR